LPVNSGPPTPHNSQPPVVQLAALARATRDFVDQVVVVTGNVQHVGADYVTDPFFVLIDSDGNWLRVDAWAPLEVPPSPPGMIGRRPLEMRDYLEKWVRLVGMIRQDARRGHYLFRAQKVEIQPVETQLGEAARGVLRQLRADRGARLREAGVSARSAARRTSGE
jgi:hypothetical protein